MVRLESETGGSRAEGSVARSLQLVHIYTQLTVSDLKHEGLFIEGGEKTK